MHFNYIALLEGRKVLTGEDDWGTGQNKWLIQGHAGNLMLCQEQSVSSLSSSQVLCPLTRPPACLPKPNKQQQPHTYALTCVHTCAHVASQRACKLKCLQAASKACSCAFRFICVHLDAWCLTKPNSLKLQPIEHMKSAILNGILIRQHFGGICFIPEIKHTGLEVPSPKLMGTRAFKGIVTRQF